MNIPYEAIAQKMAKVVSNSCTNSRLNIGQHDQQYRKKKKKNEKQTLSGVIIFKRVRHEIIPHIILK